MNKKLCVGCAPLLAVVAFALMPAVAQAVPYWYSDGIEIPQGEEVHVTTSGRLSFTVVDGKVKISKTQCILKDKETIVNPLGGGAGTDELEEFELSACVLKARTPICPSPNKIEIVAVNLPWMTELVAGSPIIDEIKDIDLETKCSGSALGTFTGALTPKLVKHTLKFGKGYGNLTDAPYTVYVNGKDSMTGPPGDVKIEAKERPCPLCA